MNKTQDHLLKPAVISLIAALCYLFVLRPAHFLEVPALKAQDLLFKIRSQITKAPSVLNQFTLIVIDDESIEKTNQKWPFKRKVFADLVDNVSKSNPRLIAFDFVFSGKSDPVDDFLLGAAFKRNGHVVLASFVDTNGNYIVPYEEFSSKASTVGIINKIQDRDLTVRTASLIYQDVNGNSVGWPWEIEIARNAWQQTEAVRINDRFVQAGDSMIPFYRGKKARINYRFGFNEVQAIPFWKLIENDKLYSSLSGKIVLIGTTSKVLHDFYHTPLGLLPGIVINMNFLTNIISHDFIRPLPSASPVLALFILTFVGLYFGFEYGALKAILSFAGMSALYVLLTAVLFLKGYLYDYFTALIFGWAGFAAVSAHTYFLTFVENIQLRSKVSLDPLTGLYNRRLLESSINSVLEKGQELSVLMIDIDNFKNVNDTYGHQFGDDVIKNVSFSIKEELREGDSAVRYGGEEFCVILARTSKEEAREIGERIRKNVEARELSYVNQVTHFTVSIGVASSKTDSLIASRPLIRAADRALYDAKKTGKNRVALFHNT